MVAWGGGIVSLEGETNAHEPRAVDRDPPPGDRVERLVDLFDGDPLAES